MLVYWSSSSENTHRFVQKLGFQNKRILNGEDPFIICEPYFLMTPTFADVNGRGAVPKPVIKFLNIEENRRNLLGVFGGGNRNFGEMFGIGAKIISYKCQVPLLYLFELSGTEEDISQVKDKVNSWKNNTRI